LKEHIYTHNHGIQLASKYYVMVSDCVNVHNTKFCSTTVLHAYAVKFTNIATL